MFGDNISFLIVALLIPFHEIKSAGASQKWGEPYGTYT